MMELRVFQFSSLIFLCVISGLNSQDQTTLLHSYSVIEEEDVGYVIGNLGRDTGLANKYDDSVYNGLSLSFLSMNDEDRTVFVIRDNKDLVIQNKIDRDSRCPNAVKCDIFIDVQVQPVDYFHIIKLTITILDLNDNSPQFPSDIAISIPESSQIGTLLSISPIAEDPDSPQFTVSGYSLNDPSGVFSLVVPDDLEPMLRLDARLDHELKNIYSLEITAIDGSGLTGSAQIQVEVTDVNDHPTKFVQRSYSKSVREDMQRNEIILTVNATDQDSGVNGEIVYGFTTKTNALLGNLFAINDKTGAISLVGQLDYEKQMSYSLTVTAQDKSFSSVPDQVKVTIKVLDVNDNSPTIHVNNLDGQLIGISEYTALNTFVAHISVKDLDSEENGKFVCNLDDNNFRLKEFYTGEYQIFTSNTFDRETKDRYDMELSCSDKGVPIRSSSKTISFEILDENDNAPIFLENPYERNITENQSLGIVLLKVSAIDPDKGENASVTYSLSGSGRDRFSIYPSSGIILAKQILDHENRTIESFTVIATDGGHPVRSSSVSVIINVLDLDDEPPVFLKNLYQFDVIEHSLANQRIGQVHAKDSDGQGNNRFSFSLDPDFNIKNSFRIDPVSGEIFSVVSLDREYISLYTLKAIATGFNSGPLKLSSSVEVRVNVLDINDWNPVFVYPRYKNETVYLNVDVSDGETVANVSANDKDYELNSKLVYSILNESVPFAINEDTGALTIMDLDDITSDIYLLSLKVRDSGSFPRSAQTLLTINCSEILIKINAQHQKNQSQNVTIIIAIVVVSAILIIVLILAIVCVLRAGVCGGQRRDVIKKSGMMIGGAGVDRLQEQPIQPQNQTSAETKNESFRLNSGRLSNNPSVYDNNAFKNSNPDNIEYNYYNRYYENREHPSRNNSQRSYNSYNNYNIPNTNHRSNSTSRLKDNDLYFIGVT